MLQQKNKDKMVSIRFQDSELKQLDQQAKAVNLSRSAYITRKLQGLPVRTARVPPVNWDTYRELGAISSSLSALAKNIHQIQNVLTMANQQGQPIPRSLPSPDDLRNIISDIEQLQPAIKQIRLELSGVISVPRE
jgi:hypothetical protein